MLLTRIITAVILIPLVIWLIYFAPIALFNAVIFIILLRAGWEWSLFCSKGMAKRMFYVIILAILTLLLYFNAFNHLLLYIFVFCLWVWSGIAVICYQKNNQWCGLNLAPLQKIMGWFMLVACGLGLHDLIHMPNGSNYVMALLLLVWANDTGAYFAGRFWGQKKLADKVSPKKTWAGLWGGAVLTLVVYFAMNLLSAVPLPIMARQLPWIFVIIYFSIIGDLFESLLKRQAGIKDSSNILPGHGGLLDRIDSLLAATPAFILMILLEHFM